MLRGLVEKIIPRLNLKEIVAQDFLVKEFFFLQIKGRWLIKIFIGVYKI